MESVPYRIVMLMISDTPAIKSGDKSKIKKKSIASKAELEKEISSKQYLWD